MADKNIVKVYTREADDNGYSKDIAASVHIARVTESGGAEPFNNNYGVLFAKGSITAKNTIKYKGVKNPCIYRAAKDLYVIAAPLCDGKNDYDEDTKGCVAMWVSSDLVDYSDMKILYLNSDAYVDRMHISYSMEKGRYEIRWKDTDGKVYINCCTDVINQVDMTMPFLLDDTDVPDCDTAEVSDELLDRMNDKMQSFRKGHEAKGAMEFSFPLAIGWADPQIFAWDGKYYFIATNDNNNNIGIFVRESDTVGGLFEDAEPVLILKDDKEKKLIQNFWAPELHIINGDIYILFAVSGETFGPQCHMMKLKKGGSISNIDDWEEPVRVKKQNGEYLAEQGITLDMTYFEAGGVSYLCWSFRRHIFSELDTGSMLYIATIDKENPYVLTSEPVLLSRPLWGWENTDNTINNEGPFAIVRNGIVYLAFSGGSAGGDSYAVGFLIADEHDDLLNIVNWYKKPFPIHTSYTVKGEYGPGHNSFFTDENGNVYIVYHAKEKLRNAPRCTGVLRLEFDCDGEPYIVL